MYDHIETLPSTTEPPNTNDINIIKKLFGNALPPNTRTNTHSPQISLQFLITCSLLFFIISQPRIDTLLQSRFNIFKTSNNMLILAKSILFFSSLYIFFSYLTN